MKYYYKYYSLLTIFCLVFFSALLFSCEPEEEAGANVTVTEANITGIWRRTDSGFTERGKEYLAAGTGWLGNYNSGVFARATAFSWSLTNAASGHTLVEYRDAVGETYNEDVAELTTTSMVLLRQQDGVSRHFTKQ